MDIKIENETLTIKCKKQEIDSVLKKCSLPTIWGNEVEWETIALHTYKYENVVLRNDNKQENFELEIETIITNN